MKKKKIRNHPDLPEEGHVKSIGFNKLLSKEGGVHIYLFGISKESYIKQTFQVREIPHWWGNESSGMVL